jgi:cytochrome bd-type quinol oxidase subunit 1
MLLSIFVIYFAMKNYRDNVAGGTIKFGKALLIGLYISIIFAVCYVITWMILRQTLLPDFVDNYIAYEKKGLQQAGLSPEVMSKKVAEIDEMKAMFSNPWMEALMVFTEPWPVAILVTLVSAFAVSRKRKQENSGEALHAS